MSIIINNMPTTVYRNITSKNADQGTYQPMRSSMGMKNSIHVNPAALALTSPAGDQIGCFSHSTDVYMRNVNRNTIDTEKTNCPTKQAFYRESRLDGGRPSTFARYADEEVAHPRPIYGASMEQMMHPMMMKEQMHPMMMKEQMHPMMMKEQMHHMPMKEQMHPMMMKEQMHPMMMKEQMHPMMMMEQYKQSGRRRENFVADKKKVIMGRMTEGYAPKRREFFTNRCGSR